MKKVIFTLACLAMASFTTFAAEPQDVKRETPAYEAGKEADLVDVIVAQYPGKTVLVDFWATWCGPCLNAMKTIEPLKPWMEENGIVRVYLCFSNSDPVKWEEMIGNIGGEHYWLKENEINPLGERYGITGIPSYQIYNKKGELSYQSLGFPGNDTMKAEFEKAL